MKELVEILNLIHNDMYPYPKNCFDNTGNTIVLFCLMNKGIFHKDGFSYVSNKNELISIPKEKYT